MSDKDFEVYSEEIVGNDNVSAECKCGGGLDCAGGGH